MGITPPAPSAALSPDDFPTRRGRIRAYFARHPVAMDLVVVAWFALPALISATISPAAAGTARFSTWSYLALTAAGSLALFFRRRRPLTVVAAITALAIAQLYLVGDTGGFELALALGIYAVATHRSSRVAWVTVVVSSLATSATAAVWSTSVGDDLGLDDLSEAGYRTGIAAGMVTFALVGMAIGISVRNRREHIRYLVDRANEMALEHDRRATASERARIAREMHDVVAHSLSVMIALADGARASLERSPERSAEALSALSGTGRSALADMRRILGVLRDGEGSVEGPTFAPPSGTSPNATTADGGAPLAPQPGGNDLTELIARFRAAGLPVRFTHSGGEAPRDAGLELTVYRIVQEGLTNVLRHAHGAERIAVEVAWQPADVTVTITNSAGIRREPPHAGSGQGLIGMRERAATYGGTVEAGVDGGGWKLVAALRFGTEEDV